MGEQAAQNADAETTVEQDARKEAKRKSGEDDGLGALVEIQENAGQVSELVKEEENLIAEFFGFLPQILKPFGKTLEIDPDALPESYHERVSRAHLCLTGELVLVSADGDVEVLNLMERQNREVLAGITDQIMENLKTQIMSYKANIEKRVKFLMTITKELQKVAKAFTEE